MRRRSGFFALTALVAAGLPSAQAADPPEQPRVNCAKRVPDSAVDDAYVNPTGIGAANQPSLKTPGLDLEAVYLRGTPDTIQLFAKVQDIPPPAEMSPRDLAFRYAFTIKYGTKSIDIAHWQKNPLYAAAVSGATYPTTNPVIDGTTAGVDPATNFVYVVLNRANLAKLVGAPVADGDPIELTAVKSEWIAQDNVNTRYKADEIVPPAALKAWTVGDNYCFGPPPAALTDVTAAAVQFSDATPLTAKLVDELGAAMPDQQVRFTVVGGGAAMVGTTNGNGVATVSYVAKAAAGTYPVRVEFPGTATAGTATATGSLTISTEPTAFRPLGVKNASATARTVTATLVDDDGKPATAQRVAWYVNGKLVTTVSTDSAGRSVYKAKPKQKVQAKFAGLSGRYGAAASNTATV
jgi:hypothetical protein